MQNKYKETIYIRFTAPNMMFGAVFCIAID